MSDAGSVRLERKGQVAHITFDRPASRNAMTMEMYGQLEAHLAALAADVVRRDRDRPGSSEAAPTPRVVVLRGASGSFVAGTDIAHFTSFRDADDGVAYEARLEAVVGALEALPIPTLAVVEGAAVGGGLVLAAACDVRLCTPDARFGAPIARTVGNCLSLANVARLVAHFGPARTKALLFLAELMDAEAARAAGFVLEVVPSPDLDDRVSALCERLVSHAPITLRVTKEAVRRALGGGGADRDLLRAAYGSDDFQRGVRAFLDKRAPEWQDR